MDTTDDQCNYAQKLYCSSLPTIIIFKYYYYGWEVIGDKIGKIFTKKKNKNTHKN